MKSRYFFNILAVLGIVATLVTCYMFYDYNRKEGISSVLIWGTSPILLFVLISSVIQLFKKRRSAKR